MRLPHIAIAAIALSCASTSAAQTPGAGTAPHPQSLDQRMAAFVDAVGNEHTDQVTAFFPTRGDWSWVLSVRTAQGRSVRVRRFPAAETMRAIQAPGPVWASFYIQPEGQPIGLFMHQVTTRGMTNDGWRPFRWRKVSGTRFVPAGEPATAGLFVEWRREGASWVISAFGDELLDDNPMPRWCC